MSKEIVWKDRKRPIFGLPLSFTRYELTDEKLYVHTGLFRTNEEEVRLYRILDLSLRRSFWDRICGVGTIHCCTADKSTPELDIKHVKYCRDVKEKLSDMVEKQRMEKRVASREFMVDHGDGDTLDDSDLF